ncbi:MAG: HAD-IC family P-type ATPase, partial [Actinomycetia bacterium]|nr:HAD-IC family P-type ATPase [Actinomycetes bacterium]
MSGSTAGDTPGRGWLQAYGHTPRSLTVSAIRMLHPRVQWHNPVLFVVMVCAAVTTLAALVGTIMRTEPSSGGTPQPPGFAWIIAGWLWLTLIAANVAESLSVGRGRSGTASLRLTRQSQATRRVRHYDPVRNPSASRAELEDVDSTHLRPSDVVLVEAGDVIPADGDVIWGAALVDESAITGESAPVIRECGGDRSAVTGGTVVLSDHLVVQVTARRGATAVDKMIRLAEGLHRQKAPNELALSALLASFSISFVLIALTVNVIVAPESPPVSIPVLAAMVACLIPTEIAALMSVTGTAGMYRLLTQGVLIDSAHALDLAGDITTVLLDKTGTITRGDRRARRFVPASGVDMERFVEAAVLASIDDPTPEGRSTLQLAAEQGFEVPETRATGRVIRFSAQTRMSGRDLPGGTMIRKGAESAVLAWLKRVGCAPSADVLEDLHAKTEAIATTGGTPLVVAIKPPTQPARVLGVIHCRDVVQPGMPERIGQLRALGIRTVMVTGDNPLTAQAIAADVG